MPPVHLSAPASAPYGRRLVAFVVDLAIVAAVAIVAAGRLDGAVARTAAVIATVLGAAAAAALLEWRLGWTPGKRLLGLRVVGIDGPLSLRGALRRELVGRLGLTVVAAPAAPAPILGYLWPLRDDRAQAWHDKIGRTRVVRAGATAPPAPGWAPPFAAREDLGPGGLVYPSWWERFAAWLIDQSIVVTFLSAVFVAVATLVGAVETEDRDPSTGSIVALYLVLGVLYLLFSAFYGGFLVGWREQTPGKSALGLVVRAEDGSRAGYGRAFTRELVGRILVEGLASLFVGGLVTIGSGLNATRSPLRQTWHDTIGGTIVVRGEGRALPLPLRRRRRAAQA